MSEVKTTLDIPDPLFRKTKAYAALRGISLRQFVAQALEEKIQSSPTPQQGRSEPPWMRGFGSLADLKEENRTVERRVAEAFEAVGDEDRA